MSSAEEKIEKIKEVLSRMEAELSEMRKVLRGEKVE